MQKTYTFKEAIKHNRPDDFDDLSLNWYLDSMDIMGDYDEEYAFDTSNVVAAYVVGEASLQYDDENYTPLFELRAYVVSSNDEDEGNYLYGFYGYGEPLFDQMRNQPLQIPEFEFEPILSIKGRDAPLVDAEVDQSGAVASKKENFERLIAAFPHLEFSFPKRKRK